MPGELPEMKQRDDVPDGRPASHAGERLDSGDSGL